ncbi:MAG TPA: hypothetical protein VL981_06215 [Candidatus Methylacidiphilales bacterium]|nr:hypothetical protein [Candidatus Methylacidiphilales bacterium]
MSAEAKNELAERFASDAARRHVQGLPLKQAELVTLCQLVRDARNGLLDHAAVRAFIVAQEMAHGRGEVDAKAHADAVLAGKASPWQKRDFGYEKANKRRPGGDQKGHFDTPLETEDITQRFFPPHFPQ